MICSLFNFCPQYVQSRRHGGGFGGLSSQIKLQDPKIETWNTINQVEFLSIFRISSPPHKRKAPLLKTFQRQFWVCCLFIFCPQEAQSYPNETRIWILTCAAAYGQPKILGGSKCLILGEQKYFVWDTAS